MFAQQHSLKLLNNPLSSGIKPVNLLPYALNSSEEKEGRKGFRVGERDFEWKKVRRKKQNITREIHSRERMGVTHGDATTVQAC
jgi:hypothetical protein